MLITDNPASYIAGHNPIMYVLSSTNVSEPGFQYILDVYVGGVFKGRIKENGTGVMDVTRIVQSYIPQDYFKRDCITPVSITPYVDFTVKAGERYLDTDGSVIQTLDMVTSTSRAYNAALPFYNAAVTSTLPYLNRFATIRGENVYPRINYGENAYITMYDNPSDAYDTLEVKFYQYEFNGGTVLSTLTHSISGCRMFNLGANINPDARSCKVVLKKSGVVLDTLYYNINDFTLYETIPLHFLNSVGGWESVHFRFKSKKKINITRKNAAQNAYRKISGEIKWDNDRVFYEQNFNYYNQYQEEMNISTGILSDEEVEWLSDLLTSTVVYTEREINGLVYFIPVTIKAESYEVKKTINGKPESLTIDIQFSAMNNTQLR